MSGTATGEDVYKAVTEYFNQAVLELIIVISGTTNGAPELLGFSDSAVIQNAMKILYSTTYIIHQSV